MQLDHVDIFYSHRFDPQTPLEETLGALSDAVKQGKALYAGISAAYKAEETRKAAAILRSLGSPCLIHQPSYSMLNRWVEGGLTKALEEERIGCIAFSPLAQGLLTNRYLKGIPRDSRASKPHGFLKKEKITPEILKTIGALNEIAGKRGQTLAEMAVAWILRDPVITTVLIGASKVSQVEDNVAALRNLAFSQDELAAIDQLCPVA
jgi:L-glyceraldehyde 3-phosphate reductase